MKERKATYACQSVFRLKFHCCLKRVVDKGEASRLAATKLRSETKGEDGVLFGLVHGGQLRVDLVLAQVGKVRVQHIHNLFNNRMM